MTKIFFYGLFMDQAFLSGQGLHPEMVGPAVLEGYRLHIGQRATLVPSDSHRAYGVVMALTDPEAHALYAEPSVSEYLPEAVQVTLLGTGHALSAVCYNLPPELGLAGTNPSYAAKLAELARKLSFDGSYVQEIAAFGDAAALD